MNLLFNFLYIPYDFFKDYTLKQFFINFKNNKINIYYYAKNWNLN